MYYVMVIYYIKYEFYFESSKSVLKVSSQQKAYVKKVLHKKVERKLYALYTSASGALVPSLMESFKINE